MDRGAFEHAHSDLHRSCRRRRLDEWRVLMCLTLSIPGTGPLSVPKAASSASWRRVRHAAPPRLSRVLTVTCHPIESSLAPSAPSNNRRRLIEGKILQVHHDGLDARQALGGRHTRPDRLSRQQRRTWTPFLRRGRPLYHLQGLLRRASNSHLWPLLLLCGA